MASKQTRRENTSNERDVKLEKDRVPKVDEGSEKASRESEKELSLEEISKLRQTAQQNSIEALKAAEEKYQKVKEKGSQGLGVATEYAKEKGTQAIDKLVEGTQKSSEYATQKASQGLGTATEYGKEKGMQAKDKVVEGTQKSSEHATVKASQAKDSVVDKGQQGYEATKDTTVKTKDYTVESAKKAAHYTTEKVVEGTKAATRAVQGAVEVAGHKAAELVGYGKQEAERESEARPADENQGGQNKEESQVHATGGRQGKEEGNESITQKMFPEEEQQQQNSGGVLQAIGETIGEIAQTTKELVVGQNQLGGGSQEITETKENK